MKKGFTLLEMVVVVSIIGILSMMGINNINNFRRDAALDSAVNELISMVKLARSKSMNGEMIIDESTKKPEDPSIFEEDGLPEYGVEILDDRYELKRTCLKTNGSDCKLDDLGESVYFADDFVITKTELYFERITGDSSQLTILVKGKNDTRGREINISDDFVITVSDTL